jgi:2-dehydro-3-deoxy-D-arabinonate dehydratase
MYLTRHRTMTGERWALDGRWLPSDVTLSRVLTQRKAELAKFFRNFPPGEPATGALELLTPVDWGYEVWACGVTYLRSRDAREAESQVKDVYARVYEAERPEIFFKAIGGRVAGHGLPIRVRADSKWNVPEPEMTLVINAAGEIVGYTAGNDVSSRDIEGENPLYLPQAKMYDGSCAIGPGIQLCDTDRLKNLPIMLEIDRGGQSVFKGETRTSQIKRPLEELVAYLRREMSFPSGVFLLTGTGIVPPPEFSLSPGDVVSITVGELTLDNQVMENSPEQP